ncbi:phosphoglucosamine mutase [Desulfovibrio sp. An276]|uniref:phosphoglucosamine mutase n=1 Tax=Desulfovibrio sp. An276 TaxID=1965618 RepID=UPI000B3A9FA0|nr:phosphoglucosamine mutase [Desulfovibrio sp. An276]OUO51893.1 phosphoglucosamine mutase [Desulfovibrio sp. An276]
MSDRFFGTDGLRGRANTWPMTVDVALRLGLAAGMFFKRKGDCQHKVVIGKDTRLSGYMFESALTAGLCAAGMKVIMTGPLPTPAISFLTRSMRADFGVVISASHNPYMDNGIKFFDEEGFKLPDDQEDAISAMVLDADYRWPYPPSDRVGRASKIEDAGGRYIVYTKSCFPAGMTLSGLRIVVDCANGASYKVAPLALEELGAEVVRVGTSPNGLNINDHVGALHPETMAAKVKEVRADVGIALDGDADRLIMADEHGTILDGDQLMAMCAKDLLDRGELPGNAIVATAMSNLALEVFMQENGGKLLRSKVGDRYVMEMMRREGVMFGGEQSGHLIFRKFSTTGDGLLAALQILRILREKDKPLSEIGGLLKLFPQKLLNVRVEQKVPFEQKPVIGETVAKIEQALGNRGRVVLRYSGTEALCRIMVEAEDPEKVELYTKELADVVRRELG